MTVASAKINLCEICWGHPPGPGVDVIFKPTNPVSQEWELIPVSKAGLAIIEAKYSNRCVIGARWVAHFKNVLAHFGMTHDTIFPEVVDTLGDP